MKAGSRARRPLVVDRPSIDSRNRRRQFGKMTSLSAAVLAALYGVSAAADDNALQEVVVTATRRALSAQDIPISITAVTGAALDQAGIQDISGLAHSVAGVNFTDKGPFGGVNGSTLIIRGLNSEATGGQLALASPVIPPVATYVDDTPLFVNLRLLDLDHVEILRGPQGTLYGSGSLGGTIRFVQNAPDPGGFDAKGEVTLSKTEHTHALNEDVNGMVNLPFSDTFAVRLNASWTDDAGFINQPNLYVLDPSGAPVSAEPGNLFSPPVKYSKDGVNAYQYRTARVAALWKPNEDFKALLSYFYQTSAAQGFPAVAASPQAFKRAHFGTSGHTASAVRRAGSSGRRQALLVHQQPRRHEGQGRYHLVDARLRHGLRHLDVVEFLRPPQQSDAFRSDRPVHELLLLQALLRDQPAVVHPRVRSVRRQELDAGNSAGVQDRRTVRLGGRRILQGPDDADSRARVLSGLQRLLQRLRGRGLRR